MSWRSSTLEVERCLAVGWSGGGPRALACVALLPDRIDAAATIASVAPRDAAGLDWLAGMGEENIAEHMAHTCRGAVSTGVWGWFDDDVACLSDWGFELGTIRRPVTIWQGVEDRFVPPAHGEWLAAHIPGASRELRVRDGHLSLGITQYGDVLDALLRDDAAARLT